MKEYNTTFTPKFCRNCDGEVKPIADDTPHPTHGYKLLCPYCGWFVGWGGKAKPVRDENGVRQRSSKWTPERLNIPHCVMCLRTRDQLGKGTLEIHHIIPVSEGGLDEPENIIVLCTACHKEAHHRRTYFKDHLEEYYAERTA